MEAAGMQGRRRRRRRRKARAGEVDSPKKEMKEEEEEEGEEEEVEEEEEEEEQKEDGEEKDMEEEENVAKEEPKSSVEDGKTSDQDSEHNLQAQVLQLLDELEETRGMVLKHEEDAMELQGFLEDERLASAQQAETFTKQIQTLYAQMRLRKDEFDSLQATKDMELEQVAQELQDAHQEIHSLRLEAEEVAAVHENEIASLQEELCRLKAELERVQQTHKEYEMEVTALRAEIRMRQESAPESSAVVGGDTLQEPRPPSPSQEVARLKDELETVQIQYADLREEFQILQASNKLMVHQLEKLETMKYNKYRSKVEDTPSLESIAQWPTDRRYSLMKQPSNQKGSCVSFWSVEIVGVASDYNEEERMEKVEEENEVDLLYQLATEEETVEKVQTQGNMSQCILAEMENEDQHGSQELDVRRRPRRRRDSDARKHHRAQQDLRELEDRYRHSQEEWEQLQEDLRLCKEEIERLNGNIPTGGRVPAGGMKPFGLFAICAGGLMLYSCLKKSSSSGSLT
ncbi:coiled-coil domain-containing protein 136 isoform X4 [Crotalus tigris]|uniref:coiled-coil domain-containing protein 136 isoform X4 n=1 Tax=Crotalus tigris TaxID=88082 RepID=UPI00192F73AF|nr:coiled-coil domain-containing protein 136 isoform X4 [Crotalus tigris]